MKVLYSIAAFCLVLLAGCAYSGSGGISNIRTETSSAKGIATDIHFRGYSAGAASPAGEGGSLRGVSTHHCILLGFLEWGNTGAGTAALNGGIAQVQTVQKSSKRILWGVLYSSDSTIVTGEATVTRSPEPSVARIKHLRFHSMIAHVRPSPAIDGIHFRVQIALAGLSSSTSETSPL